MDELKPEIHGRLVHATSNAMSDGSMGAPRCGRPAPARENGKRVQE